MNPSSTQQASEAERDRRLQSFLAQARGLRRNAALLSESFDVMLRLRAARKCDSSGARQSSGPLENDGAGRTAGSSVMHNALWHTLSAVSGALEKFGATYAITGSVASSIHGEPFMSQDVDLLVLAAPAEAVRLVAELTPRFYAPPDMIREAATRHEMANLIDNDTGLKVDLSFVPPTGYLSEAVARRVRLQLGEGGPEYWFVTPEDIILMKLLWRKDTRSTKQWDNALSVARVRGARMDWKMLFESARKLSIEDDLIRLRDEAGI